MTAEKVLNNTFDKHEWRMASHPYHDSEEAVLQAMKEYAKMKCKELLEIVAEEIGNGSWYVNEYRVLEDFNLDEFIK